MTHLLCALCGGPLSAVNYIGRENHTRLQHVGWHPDCYEADELASAHWPALVKGVAARGPGRVGEIEEGA